MLRGGRTPVLLGEREPELGLLAPGSAVIPLSKLGGMDLTRIPRAQGGVTISTPATNVGFSEAFLAAWADNQQLISDLGAPGRESALAFAKRLLEMIAAGDARETYLIARDLAQSWGMVGSLAADVGNRLAFFTRTGAAPPGTTPAPTPAPQPEPEPTPDLTPGLGDLTQMSIQQALAPLYSRLGFATAPRFRQPTQAEESSFTAGTSVLSLPVGHTGTLGTLNRLGIRPQLVSSRGKGLYMLSDGVLSPFSITGPRSSLRSWGRFWRICSTSSRLPNRSSCFRRPGRARWTQPYRIC